MQCEERDALVRRHAEATERMHAAVRALNELMEETISPSWGKRVEECDRLTLELMNARDTLEAHRREHGC